MDSLQLDRICRALLKNAFVGVFAENELKSLRQFERPCGLIVNTEPTPDPGLHWTAIYLHVDNTGEFFDSFALDPDEPVKRFLGIHAPRGYTCNTRAVQSLLTTTCGGFCIVYLDGRRRRPEDSMYVLLQRLFPHRDTWTNDLQVDRFLRERFGLNLPLIDHQLVIKSISRFYGGRHRPTVFRPKGKG